LAFLASSERCRRSCWPRRRRRVCSGAWLKAVRKITRKTHHFRWWNVFEDMC